MPVCAGDCVRGVNRSEKFRTTRKNLEKRLGNSQKVRVGLTNHKETRIPFRVKHAITKRDVT